MVARENSSGPSSRNFPASPPGFEMSPRKFLTHSTNAGQAFPSLIPASASARRERSSSVVSTHPPPSPHIAEASPHADSAGWSRKTLCHLRMKSRYDSTKLRTSSPFIAAAKASANARRVFASVRRRTPNDMRESSAPARNSSMISARPSSPSSSGNMRTTLVRKLSSVPICERCCVATTFLRSAADSWSDSAFFASRDTNRSNISPAAARENVSATISCGSTPPFASAISLSASACVLPVPADASMRMFPFIADNYTIFAATPPHR